MQDDRPTDAFGNPQAPRPYEPPVAPTTAPRPQAGHVVAHHTQTSSKALAALVFGIVGLVVVPVIGSVVALVLGYQARGEIDASGGRIGGRANATAGIVMGWVGVALGVLFVLFVIFVLLAVGGLLESLPEPEAMLVRPA